MPDDELLQLAEKGKLKDPAILEQQVRRMLADERSRTLVTNFAAQWLYLRNVRLAKPDSFQFPGLGRRPARARSSRETELFLDYQIRADRGVAELLTADYTLPQRAAREALRHPERLRQSFPPRRVHATKTAAAGCSATAASCW